MYRCNFKPHNSPFTSAQYINCSDTNKNRPTTTTRNINKESALIGTVNQISIISMFGSIVTDQVAHDGWHTLNKWILESIKIITVKFLIKEHCTAVLLHFYDNFIVE